MCRGRADHEIISPGRRSYQCNLPFLHYKPQYDIIVYNILLKLHYNPQYDIVVYNILLKLSCCTGVAAGNSSPWLQHQSAWSVLQAEVQSVYADGALLLHTRSLKYGKVSCCNYTVIIQYCNSINP